MAIDKIQSESINLADNFAFTGTVSGAGGVNTPNFKVSNSGNTSCANGTFVKLSADTETFDSDSAFASDKFTVPSGKGGKYIFTARVYMPVNSDSEYTGVSLYKNGGAHSTTSHVHQNFNILNHVGILKFIFNRLQEALKMLNLLNLVDLEL